VKFYKILIIDDDQSSIDFIKKILEDNNYIASVAKNGKAGIAKAKSNDFQLILLDIFLPDMNGIEVCRQLKEFPSTMDIPIIFLTAYGKKDNIAKGYKAGGVDFIIKPIVDVELLARISTHIKFYSTLMALSEAKKDAVIDSELKKGFLANMSHEIRSPLNGIIGTVNMLYDTELSEEQGELVNILYASGEKLISIVNNILDFAKIDTGKIEIEKNAFNIKNEIDELIIFFSNVAERKKIKLYAEIDDDIPSVFVGDAARIKQILSNLISNALKYTATGSVVLKVSNYEKYDEDTFSVIFSVCDTGVGMSAEIVSTLFSGGGDVDIVDNKYGSGVGLIMAKKMVELLGGSIGVSSEVNKGSVFLVSVPFKFSSDKPKQIITQNGYNHTAKENLNILIAEDFVINQKVIKFSFKKLGYTPCVVDNGELAVQEYIKNNYDIVFLDIQMPVMDGYEAASRIRKYEKEYGKKKKATIVAMTASTMKEEIEKCYASGMDDVVKKPFKIEDIIKVLDKL